MSKHVISKRLRTLVMERGRHCCEYCKSQDRFSPVFFTIDHIVPIEQGGTNTEENLAYACMLCNRLKWHRFFAPDPATRVMTRLFHPRQDVWLQHFQWSDDYLHIIGMTPVGRATVDALDLNRGKLLAYRKEMAQIGSHPPLEE